MKLKIDIDCTPEEARAFLGLPDVAPLQSDLMKTMQERLTQTLAAMEPEQLLKTWLPAGIQGLDQMQKAFWEQFKGAGRGGSGG